MPSVEGVGARRAALQMLDAVLRRGQTLDAAAARSRGPVARRPRARRRHRRRGAAPPARSRRADRQRDAPAPARRQQGADGAAPRARAEDRARHARPCAGRDRLPLVDGGPRRLVHGVLGTLLRRGVPPMDAPRLPDAVEQRWRAAWGEEVVEAARRQIAKRPPLDLSFADDAEAQAYAAANGGIRSRRAMSGSTAASVAELPGFGEGRWWVQDLAASLPARLIPGRGATTCSTCAPRPAARRCSSPPPAISVTAVDASRKSSRTTARESRAHASRGRAGRRRRADVEAGPRSSTRSCSTRPARRPAPSAAIPRSSTAPGRRSSPTAPSCRRSCSPAPPTG